MEVATRVIMRALDPLRWDDLVLAGLLLLIAVPRVVLGILYDRPFGVEDTLSLVCVALALGLVLRRRR